MKNCLEFLDNMENEAVNIIEIHINRCMKFGSKLSPI
jgi:hypothetical protein